MCEATTVLYTHNVSLCSTHATAFGSLYVSWPLAVEASSMYRVDVMGPFLEPSGLVPSQFAGLIENKKREV